MNEKNLSHTQSALVSGKLSGTSRDVKAQNCLLGIMNETSA